MDKESITLGDLYKEFDLIDTDAPGGYARVCKVKSTLPHLNLKSCYNAFKVMRWNVEWEAGFPRFIDEIRVLIQIFGQKNLSQSVSDVVTRLYDFGFVSSELPRSLDKYQTPNEGLDIIQIKNLTKFVEMGEELQKDEPDKWRPYLVVDLAGYDDSLFRQINRRPKIDIDGLYRLPTGEVIYIAGKLLDTLEYLHTNIGRAYMDWKPEHIFWNGKEKSIKLIDWNVTFPLEDYPGKEQNIRDDIRLFCGAVLYSCLTMVDLEGKQIGAQPTTPDGQYNPTPEVRRRYWTYDPVFYEANKSLDEKIKAILRRGLIPDQGYSSTIDLKHDLYSYAETELGLKFGEDSLVSGEAYWKAIEEIRIAQEALFKAYGLLSDAILSKGAVLEYTRLSRVINQTFDNFPMP